MKCIQGDEAIYANDHLVGNTTSGCYSPALGASLAFCYLPPFLAAPDTIVQVFLIGFYFWHVFSFCFYFW